MTTWPPLPADPLPNELPESSEAGAGSQEATVPQDLESAEAAPVTPAAAADASLSPADVRADGVPTVTLAVRALILLAAEAGSLALCVWTLRLGDRRIPFGLANVLTKNERWYGIGNVAVSALLVSLAALALMVARRRPGVLLAQQVARRCAPLVLTALLPYLLDWRLWENHELELLLLDVVFALGLQSLARTSVEAGPVLPARIPGRIRTARAIVATRALLAWRGLPVTIVVLAAAGYAAYFSHYTMAGHDRLGTSSFDLGLEDNLVWNAIRGARLFKMSPFGGPDATHAGNHQTYFAYVIGLVYAVVPGPKTLLAVQAALMGGAAVPLWFFAAKRIGPWAACLVAVCYLMYPPLHGANLYDFHYLPLGVFFLWLALHFLQERRDVWAAITVVIALSVREDVGALMAVLGLLLAVSGERPRAGLVLMVVGGLTFVTLKFGIMPRYSGGQSFVHQYKLLLPQGEHGFGGVMKTVLANPLFTTIQLSNREKLVYVLQILAPLAFLPLRRGTALVACLPGFIFTLLATEYPPLVQISFQYTTYWTALLFPVVVLNLQWYGERSKSDPAMASSRVGWLWALAGAAVVTSLQYGAVLQRHTARGGFGRFEFKTSEHDRNRHRIVYELIRQVPPRAKIVASEPLVPHVSSRPDAYTLRLGLYDAEWLLFSVPIGGDERRHALDAFRNENFGVVDDRGEFVLARRGHDRTKNAAVLSRIGD